MPAANSGVISSGANPGLVTFTSLPVSVDVSVVVTVPRSVTSAGGGF